MGEAGALFGLFASAFLAATLLPAQSESVLVYLVYAGEYPLWLLVAIASVGNVLGSLVNWWLGIRIEHYRDRRWFPVSAERLQQAQNWYGKYGRWSLLASWLPVIGDPLTLVAGVMKEPLPSFLLIVSIAKAGRYLVLAMATAGWS